MWELRERALQREFGDDRMLGSKRRRQIQVLLPCCLLAHSVTSWLLAHSFASVQRRRRHRFQIHMRRDATATLALAVLVAPRPVEAALRSGPPFTVSIRARTKGVCHVQQQAELADLLPIFGRGILSGVPARPRLDPKLKAQSRQFLYLLYRTEPVSGPFGTVLGTRSSRAAAPAASGKVSATYSQRPWCSSVDSCSKLRSSRSSKLLPHKKKPHAALVVVRGFRGKARVRRRYASRVLPAGPGAPFPELRFDIT